MDQDDYEDTREGYRTPIRISLYDEALANRQGRRKPVEDFLCQALFTVFRAFVLLALVVIPFHTGHNLRVPSCMSNK